MWNQAEQFGPSGAYYRRGVQLGLAIRTVWPNATVLQIYGIHDRGWYWYLKGHKDAGLRVQVGLEHTYGGGPCAAGEEWDHCRERERFRPGNRSRSDRPPMPAVYQANTTMGVIRNDLRFFDFLNASDGVAAGLFPWDLSKNATNYRVEDFEAQLRSALCDSPAGPVPVWLWQAGVLTPEALAAVPRGAEFVAVLKRYSRQGAAGGGRAEQLCAKASASSRRVERSGGSAAVARRP